MKKFKQLGSLQAVLHQLFRQKRQIYLFGNSGSGKSQFVKSLKNSIEIPARTFTAEKTAWSLDDIFINFIDTPGHQTLSRERRQSVSEILKYNAEGIIQFVTYGYDEAGTNKSAAINGNRVREDFLSQNRQQEFNQMKHLVRDISPNAVKWVIILVNKADIWWNNHQIVLENYEQNVYIDVFQERLPNAQILVLPYCGIIRPFFGASHSGQFGEQDKEDLYDDFIDKLLKLLKP